MLRNENKIEPFLEVIKDDIESAERKLWIDFKNGHEQAFNKIFDKYVNALYSYGCKIVSDGHLIKDCIQELFIDLWRNKESLTEPQSVKLYLFRSMRRKVFRLLKKENRFAAGGIHLHDIAFEIVPSPELEIIDRQSGKEKKDFLITALNKLSKRQREALYLKYFSEMNNREIARIMSLKRQSVYNLINDGLNTLRSTLLTPVAFVGYILILFFQ